MGRRASFLVETLLDVVQASSVLIVYYLLYRVSMRLVDSGRAVEGVLLAVSLISPWMAIMLWHSVDRLYMRWSEWRRRGTRPTMMGRGMT